jgi:hypothetical protein
MTRDLEGRCTTRTASFSPAAIVASAEPVPVPKPPGPERLQHRGGLAINPAATIRWHPAFRPKGRRGSPQRDGSRGHQRAPALGSRSF